jgi:NAD(P)H-dependent FMN reductase
VSQGPSVVPTASQVRVLGIVGSPRRKGNTEILVDEVLRGAAEAGATIEKVILTRLNVSPCLACDGCRRTGQCVQRDDLAPLLEQMQASRVWVLGTPLYWFGPSAQLKAFVDRWYSTTAERSTADFRGRRVILAVPMEDEDPAGARHAVGMLTDAVEWIKAEVYATILATGVAERGAVRGHPEVLEAAREAGRRAVTLPSPPTASEQA